ncbi:hypothetical protein D3C78_1368690 [compost metagenome]
MGQLFAQILRLWASQPVASGSVVAPVIEGAFAGGIGFNHVQPRQLVLQPLYQAGVDLFLLPHLQHFLAETVGAECGHVMHLQRAFRHLAGNVDGGV